MRPKLLKANGCHQGDKEGAHGIPQKALQTELSLAQAPLDTIALEPSLGMGHLVRDVHGHMGTLVTLP